MKALKELYKVLHYYEGMKIPNIGIHPSENGFRVYHSDGYCFDLDREFVSNDYEGDGYEYKFWSGYEGFKECDQTKAIHLVYSALIDWLEKDIERLKVVQNKWRKENNIGGYDYYEEWYEVQKSIHSVEADINKLTHLKTNA